MNKTNFGLGILVAIVGLLVMINPESSIRVIVILLGAASLIGGIYSLAKRRNLLDDSLYSKSILIRGVASIVMGVLAMVMPIVLFNAAMGVLRIVLYIVAVYFLLSAFAEIFSMVRLSQAGLHDQVKGLFWTAIGSVVIAILLFMLPKNYGTKIIQVLGALLMLGGIGYTLYLFVHKPIVIEPENIRDDDSADSESESEV